MNNITFKIKYASSDSFLVKSYIKNFNSVLRFTYNRILDNQNISTKDLTAMQSCMKNVFIKSHLKNSVIYKAREIYSKNKGRKVIFGGKSNLDLRNKNKISQEEFREDRLLPLLSIGEANNKGNRLFTIVNNKTILFKPEKDKHVILNLQSVGRKRSKELDKLIKLQDEKVLPITYQLSKEYVYITFNYNYLKSFSYPVKQNRIMAIDINPNYIGYSICDWKQDYNFQLIKSGMISLKPLNDYANSLSVSSDSKEAKYITNKRNHEVIEIAKDLFGLCKHYHCEVFAMEDLSIKSGSLDKGRKLNRLINNQWNRNLLINQINKHINASSTFLVRVQPQYSSIIGNLVNRRLELPDAVLASIEISRRGYEFSTQYIFNRRQRNKTVIFPELDKVKDFIVQSMEELNCKMPDSNEWKELWSVVKKSKVKYRFPLLEKYSNSPFSKNLIKRKIILYSF